MRVVALSETIDFAARALLQVGLRGIAVERVLIAPRPIVPAAVATAAAIRARSPRRVVGAVLRRLSAFVDPPTRLPMPPPLEGLAERVVWTDPLNSPAMLAELEAAQPELLFLTATGLVVPNVLAIPKVATLNSHPGLLPWVRGNGAVEYAIRQRIPVGVSVHHVDAGADTGDTIARHLVPVTAIDTLSSIRQKADELRWSALADIIQQFVLGTSPPRTAQVRRFPSSRWPTTQERAEAERLVAVGEAYRRYLTWRERVGSNALPPEDAVFNLEAPT